MSNQSPGRGFGMFLFCTCAHSLAYDMTLTSHSAQFGKGGQHRKAHPQKAGGHVKSVPFQSARGTLWLEPFSFLVFPCWSSSCLRLWASFGSFLPFLFALKEDVFLVEEHPRQRQAALQIMTATLLASTSNNTHCDMINVVAMTCTKQTYLASAGRRSSSLLS